jgi:hypothetical protein
MTIDLIKVTLSNGTPRFGSGYAIVDQGHMLRLDIENKEGKRNVVGCFPLVNVVSVEPYSINVNDQD